MYTAKICLNSVPGGPINFVIEADISTTPPPTRWAENSCYGSNDCLGTGRRNLHFLIEYFKNEKVYQLQNRQIYLPCGFGHMTQF